MKAIRRDHALENEITRHRITSFQFVEHADKVGCFAIERKCKAATVSCRRDKCRNSGLGQMQNVVGEAPFGSAGGLGRKPES